MVHSIIHAVIRYICLCLEFIGDRHGGNFGYLYNNDTMQVIAMAPVYDLNLSLMPYKSIAELKSPEKINFGTPKLGSDFTLAAQGALTDEIRDALKDIKDFEFSFRGDKRFPAGRIKALEHIVQKQAEAILSPQLVRTKDIFLSGQDKDLGFEPADGPVSTLWWDEE